MLRYWHGVSKLPPTSICITHILVAPRIYCTWNPVSWWQIWAHLYSWEFQRYDAVKFSGIELILDISVENSCIKELAVAGIALVACMAGTKRQTSFIWRMRRRNCCFSRNFFGLVSFCIRNSEISWKLVHMRGSWDISNCWRNPRQVLSLDDEALVIDCDMELFYPEVIED